MMLSKDRIGGVLLLLFCLIYAWLSQDIRLLPFQERAAFHARTMPEILSILGIGLALWTIILPGKSERPELGGADWLKAGLFLVLMSAYGFTVRPLGFILSTSLFLMIGYALLGERKVVPLVLASVPLVVAFWVLMTQGLDVFIEPWPGFLRE
ncbi:tripartite tricarboxylate transporter TctB family protein [Boseongicola sp. H5]|uniref:tripartite tricarboxylate transporter TctB family protein n=1 Tax=Rhodobacterales TaxID=204455 RepID=UPI001AFED578|nr:tripartite tricarboxylate transporter TctB family protein [Boseongicola sp. H5]MBO6603138.1 tripartite tricarboxylate transporter TctB family protein [Roseicyclus sp.]MBO6625610.1 tripartite tricarboxylate transporter TctB family protein [Roseicyclus sp.]MBO6921010.1 tripartite tricarboxylate transporter TctB family protein [Roseicyclus sp.]